MYIRRTLSKAGKGRKKYYTYRLVESYRVGDKVRQRTLLSLGSDFSLPKEQWADLARRIEEILQNRGSLLGADKTIETLAQNYASRILVSQSRKVSEDEAEYTPVAIEAIQKDRSRHIGVETILYETMQRLKLPELFKDLGCSLKQNKRLQALLIAKAIDGGSEKGMLEYLKERSGASELIGLEAEELSLSSFYRTGDLLHTHKETITSYLYEEQKELLNLKGHITLFDLTNTYFEGEAQGTQKAQRGRSKEKRSDAPLITLALIVDGDGALKGAELYAGNVSEASTFQEMMHKVYGEREEKKDTTLFREAPPIVSMDAGIATEANIEWLKEEGYRYIVVSRKHHTIFVDDESVVVNAEGDADKEVSAYRHITPEGEIELYCRSKAREAKEEAMFAKSNERFLEALEYLKKGLSLPRRTKKYEKVLEKIGRLRERYAYAAQHYTIEVSKDPKGPNATRIQYHKKEEKKDKDDSRYGVYCLRSNLSEMDEKELWHTYITLTEIEAVFRSLKSELGLRPIYHHKEERIDAHLFLTLIAYTLVHTIRHQLKKKGIHDNWETIRKNLSTLMRSTLSLPTKEGVIHLRLNDRAEALHRQYFDALNIFYGSNKRKTTVCEQM